MYRGQSKRRGQASQRGSRSDELMELALWMAASLAGMVTAILLVRRPFFERLAARLGRRARRSIKPSRRQSLPMLAEAIVGSTKMRIEAVLGPPRSAALRGIAVVVRPKMVFWQADIWYYPLPSQGATAMAINFDKDLATQVEFFTTPRRA